MHRLHEERRLSCIATQWTMLLKAHAQSNEASDLARALVQRYIDPVYRYLLGAVGDADVAEELCHDFVVRFLEGRFSGAHPEKGRFRDYLKRTLMNLVNDHYRQQDCRPLSLRADVAGVDPPEKNEAVFDARVRQDVLQRTWQALAEANHGYYTVLRLRADHPSDSSSELARELTANSDETVTAAAVRKTLERARVKFGQLLVEEVASLADTTSPNELRRELEELDLLKYCRFALREQD